MSNELKLLSSWLSSSSNVVVFTGAGMSTESGLPDFRSPDGMWKKQDPRQLASVRALNLNTHNFFEFYRMRVENLKKATPHDGHLILAAWEEKKIIKHIITQNVDGFHFMAGSKDISELHGSLRYSYCNDCKKEYPVEILFSDDLPQCQVCQGKVRPGVVLFGENLPHRALETADRESSQADLFIVIGSSLEVSPANYFPVKAKNAGARLVIINLEETPLDGMADIIIRGKAKEVLQEVDKLISSSLSPSF